MTVSQPKLNGALTGKVALVTGGSRGIGLAIALELVSHGCFVFVTGRDPKALKAAEESLGQKGQSILCDVREEKSVQSALEEVKKSKSHLDFLINNAGTAHALQNVDELPSDIWQDVIATNLTGLFLVTHHALRLLRSGGVIINNISIAAFKPFVGFSAYNASKAGVLGFTNTLREELRSRNIRVTALFPGAVNTEIWQQFLPEAPKEKMVQPETVARMVARILELPPETATDELHIGPASGTL